EEVIGKNANIYIENEYLFTATVGRTGQIRVNKDSDLGKALLQAAVFRAAGGAVLGAEYFPEEAKQRILETAQK
ncbi:MAG: hypothetical protein KKB25_03170, partial [Nanoarchaeota archaeon]|nr:hypothetical protein [Nanoarchaeota archaeon]